MAKFYGNVAFAIQAETEPGIWEDIIETRPYKGDVLANRRKFDASSETVNDEFSLANRFSLVSDTFLYSHLPAIRYIEYLGSKFKVTSVEIERPRVILSVGGVYEP